MEAVWEQADTIPREKYPREWKLTDFGEFSGIVEVESLEED